MKTLTFCTALCTAAAAPALALDYSCRSEVACLTTTGCQTSASDVRIALAGADALQFQIGAKSEMLTTLPAQIGTRVMAYGSGYAGSAMNSLTLFDNLTFTYTSHVKLVWDRETGATRGMNVTVLGRCD